MTTAKSGASHKFKLGYLATNNSNPTALSMIQWATFALNNDRTVLNDTYIELHYLNPTAGNNQEIVASTLSMVEEQVQGVIINMNEANTNLVATFIANSNIPILSTSSTTEIFDNKAPFNNLMARLQTPASYQSQAIISMLKVIKATKVHYIFTNDAYGDESYYVFLDLAEAINITVVGIPIVPGAQAPKIDQQIYDARVFIFAAGPNEGIPYLTALDNAKVYGPDYLYILSYSIAIYLHQHTTYKAVLFDGAFIMISELYKTTSPYFVSTLVGWRGSNATIFPGTRPDPTNSVHIDAVRIYANSIDYLIKQGTPAENLQGRDIYNTLVGLTQQAQAGPFQFNSEGDKIGNFLFYNTQGANGTLPIGYFDSTADTLNVTGKMQYFNGSTVSPLDIVRISDICSFSICNYQGNCSDTGVCICRAGFHGPYCEYTDSKSIDTKTLLAWVIPVGVVVVIIIIATMLYLRKRRLTLMKEVKDRQRSEFGREDIRLLDRIGRGASGEVFTGTFRGTEVAVKKLTTQNASKDVIDDFMFEIAIMCGLRHPNIVLFMGSCYDQVENEVLLVMELMQKGSLHDVLHNPKISLPFDLQVHLAGQAAQGMVFLHASNPPIIHRDMKSHNILLDDKWNARISDFGITRFKEMNSKKQKNTMDQSLGTVFWTAPEVLNSQPHTEKSDVYSFGVVLWEMFHRQEPYLGKDVMVVAMEVASKGLRPQISPSVPAEIQDLIKQCWDQDPNKRPFFPEILTTLRAMMAQHPLNNLSVHGGDTRVAAPTGVIFLVQTEVSNTNTLWNSIPRVYQQSLIMHNRFMRTSMELYGAYELEFTGSGFLMAFGTIQSALDWCFSTQTALMNLDWPKDLLEFSKTAEVRNSVGDLVWRGLRVRMAIHVASPAMGVNLSNGRSGYTGPVGERTKEILATAKEGFVIASYEVVEEINSKKVRAAETFATTQINGASRLYTLCPENLTGRKAILPNQSSSAILGFTDGDEGLSLSQNDVTPLHPHSVTPGGPDEPLGNGAETTDDPAPKWKVGWSELDLKQSLGRGAIGDHHRALMKGQEVVVKILVNQKIQEDDMIRLIADASVLSKIKHPNICPVVGVCTDKNHISFISKFVEKGSLRSVLNTAGTSLPHERKVAIALDIAKGMAFLSSHPDRDVNIHDNFKSNNILLSADWEAKITDYGQSNIKDLARTMTSVANVGWTAPEVLEGIPLGPMCAIYSFGIILWEIYTRKMPYEGEHPIRVVTKILGGYRPAIPVDCPAPYKALIENCWNGDPALRPTWQVIQSELTHMTK